MVHMVKENLCQLNKVQRVFEFISLGQSNALLCCKDEGM